MSDLTVDSRRDGDFGLVELQGEARLERIDAFRRAARGLLSGGAKHVLVGVKGLSFADSASLGVLLEIDKACRSGKGSFVVHGVTSRLEKILGAMGLSGRLQTAANEAAARRLAGP